MIKFCGFVFMVVLLACASIEEGVGVSEPPFVTEAEYADAGTTDVPRNAAVARRVSTDAGTSD